MTQQYKAWTQKAKQQGGGVWGLDLKNNRKTLKTEQTQKASDVVFCYFKKRYNHWTVTVMRKENTLFIITGENWEVVKLHPQDKVITIWIKCISTRRDSFRIDVQYIIMFSNTNAEIWLIFNKFRPHFGTLESKKCICTAACPNHSVSG